MQSIVAYVRSLIGWCDENPVIRTSFKRDRVDDDLSSDDDAPAHRKLKQLKTTNYPDYMSSRESEREEKRNSNVRYIPIQVESGHLSTSTPNPSGSSAIRRNIPVKLVDVSENIPLKYIDVTDNGLTPRKPRMHTPVRPVIHAVVDDDDDGEVTWVKSSQVNSKKPSKLYINLDDEDDQANEGEDDVIFVKKVQKGPASKPYSVLLTKSNQDDAGYYRLSRKINRDGSPLRTYTKFKVPPGITKTYKKSPTPIPKWLQSEKTNGSQLRQKFFSQNGNIRSTLSELYNLDEKKNYQDLIRKVSESMKPVSLGKPLDIINLAEDAASFRNTQKAQKKALNDIRSLEKGLNSFQESEANKEYDPITVASINSSDSEVEIIPSESSSSSVKIDPINSLKDSFKDKAIIADDWLSKFNSKYKKRLQETQEKLREARRECDIISKVNSEQKIAHLEHKLKYELSIPESLFEEPQPTVEFPKLTPEQEKLVNRALGPGPATQMLVEKFNLRIHRRDLQTLSGLNWLNDEVINFYMNLLMQRSEERKELPKVYATNTFFYPKLMQSGQAGLRRWTRKVDIFAHDIIVVPVHLGVHWCLSLIEFKKKRVAYLDSMGGRNQACLDALMQYLRDEHQDKKGAPFSDDGWRTECLKDIPQQMNGSDCGMFACTFAEFSCRNAAYSFSQAHMPYLRRKAALEILTARLLL